MNGKIRATESLLVIRKDCIDGALRSALAGDIYSVTPRDVSIMISFCLDMIRYWTIDRVIAQRYLAFMALVRYMKELSVFACYKNMSEPPRIAHRHEASRLIAESLSDINGVPLEKYMTLIIK